MGDPNGDRELLEINGKRLLQRLWDLAEIGPIEGGGTTGWRSPTPTRPAATW